jgi:uncharacterized caspase-like protein
VQLRRYPSLFAALVVVILSPPSPAQQAQSGEKYALVVGVRSYDPDELRDVQYAESDADGLAKVLRRGGYKADNVVLMTQSAGASNPRFLPTAEAIRKELKRLAEVCKPEDGLVVAVAGQGVQFRDGPRTYFCPAHAKLTDKSTLIPFEEIYEVLGKSPAGLKLLLVDVSHRDPQSDRSREKSGALLESVARPQKTSVPMGLAALFSCAAEEESYDHADLKHGVFFHQVIEGLAGASAPVQARDVTLELLEPFVKREVSSFVRTTHFERQMPALFGQTSRSAPIAAIDEGQRAIRKAQELVKAGDLEKALAALDELVRVNPTFVAARLERATIYNELKRYDESNADAAEAVKLEPKNPDLRLTGPWYGTYAYPDGGGQDPVRFRLNFVQNASKISLNVKEPKTFGGNDPNVGKDAPFLYALGTGQYDPATRELKFTKTYDGVSGVSHSVEYTATISEDGNKIEGTWNIGGAGGTFKAQRGAPNKDDHEDLN